MREGSSHSLHANCASVKSEFLIHCEVVCLRVFVFCAVIKMNLSRWSMAWQHTSESEQSWAQEQHGYGILPPNSLWSQRWKCNGLNGLREKNHNKEKHKQQQTRDRQKTIGQTEMACRGLHHSAIHSSIPQLGYTLTWRACVHWVSWG